MICAHVSEGLTTGHHTTRRSENQKKRIPTARKSCTLPFLLLRSQGASCKREGVRHSCFSLSVAIAAHGVPKIILIDRQRESFNPQKLSACVHATSQSGHFFPDKTLRKSELGEKN